MESEKPLLLTETFVIGALLAHIYELEQVKDQRADIFAQAVATEIEKLLPNFHFVICEDCWDDVFLERALISHTAFIKNKPYLVALFESGRLVCQKRDLKGRTGRVRSSAAVDEDKKDFRVITFAKRPDFDIDKEFNAAFEKLKSSIMGFDKLMDIVKKNLSGERDEQKNVTVEKTENGIIYTVGPKKN